MTCRQVNSPRSVSGQDCSMCETNGTGVFTMTFSSVEVVYISFCYNEWPSLASKFLHSSCLFHPQPYNFTIHPGYPYKIGRPLRNILSDHITVSVNVTDSGGNHANIHERFIVDGSLPTRSVTLATERLTIDFSIVCEKRERRISYVFIFHTRGKIECVLTYRLLQGEANVHNQRVFMKYFRITIYIFDLRDLVTLCVVFVGYVTCVLNAQQFTDLHTARNLVLY
ncbi:hypothetical protein DICVIV_10757 [Dictyocaulus viviparus]|uniref:Uncharacterized protein n=1 Tax=Dictyocaulus viviparus TaxID=29172 RepID=A0A0D8XLI3_DICVI|nr:hypothetical protein DICVIV_10757 [Dictyocaulus viviparus]